MLRPKPSDGTVNDWLWQDSEAKRDYSTGALGISVTQHDWEQTIFSASDERDGTYFIHNPLPHAPRKPPPIAEIEKPRRGLKFQREILAQRDHPASFRPMHWDDPTLERNRAGREAPTDMRAFTKKIKSLQGELVFIKDGALDRLPAIGSNDWIQRQYRCERAERRFHDYLKRRRNYNMTMMCFKQFDHTGGGYIPVEELPTVLRALPIGFDDYDIEYVMSRIRLVDSYGMFNYQEYVTGYRNRGDLEKVEAAEEVKIVDEVEEAGRRRDKRAGGAIIRTVAGGAEAIPLLSRTYLGTPEHSLIKLIFMGGFICCPIWCLAWPWIRSQNRSTRYIGILSLIFATCFGTIAIVGSVSFYYFLSPDAPINSNTANITLDHCPHIIGVIGEIRANGSNARPAFFWNMSLVPVTLRQTALRRTLLSLYLEDVAGYPGQGLATPSTSPEDLVYIDSILPMSGDPQRMTVSIIFKIVARDETQAKMIKGWVEGSWESRLKEMLETYQIFFSHVFLRSRSIPSDSAPPIVPDIFEQTRLAYDVSSAEWSTNQSVITSLLRQPPIEGNVMDPNNPGWTKFNDRALQTCWYMKAFDIKAGRGYVSNTVGERRRFQVELRTNGTLDLFHIFVRQSYDAFSSKRTASALMPGPRWFMDTAAGSITTAGAIDSTRCYFGLGCFYTYTLNIEVSIFETYWWIGVVGKLPSAQYIPFELRTRVLTTPPDATIDTLS